MRWRDVDVEDEVLLSKLREEHPIQELGDERSELRSEVEEEVKVIHLPLADGEKAAVAHETPEFEGRVEIECFPEDEVVRYRVCGSSVRIDAAVKCVLEVVGDEVG